MKHVKLLVAVAIFLFSSAFAGYAEETKQESTPAVSPDTNRGVTKQDSAPAPQDVKQEGHDHAAMKEKRFVAVVGTDGVQHVEIIGGEYYFDPNYIIVKVNVPVELSARKTKGYVPHNVMVKAPDAGIDFNVDLSDKEAKTIKFTPTKTGKYEMVCNKRFLFFKSHKERGMDGFIEVVE